jgi:hypothetical protein
MAVWSGYDVVSLRNEAGSCYGMVRRIFRKSELACACKFAWFVVDCAGANFFESGGEPDEQ